MSKSEERARQWLNAWLNVHVQGYSKHTTLLRPSFSQVVGMLAAYTRHNRGGLERAALQAHTTLLNVIELGEVTMANETGREMILAGI